MVRLFHGFSLKRRVLFIKRLAFLVGAKVPMVTALRMLRDQSRSSGQKKILNAITVDVEKGKMLSTSIAPYKHIFGDLEVNVIRVGEHSGMLHDNLLRLSEELKKRHLLKKKILSSLAYPALVGIATIGLAVLITVFVFPKVLPIFTSLSVDLPWATRTLMGISGFLISYGIFLLIGLGLIIVAIIILLRIKKFHLVFDEFLLRLPIVGRLNKTYNVTNVCRTLGTLLSSGIRVLEAIERTGSSTKNLVYKRELQALHDRAQKGGTLAPYLLKRKKYFPLDMSQLVSIAESTGNLSETLIYLSEMFENEVDDLAKNLSSSLEPILMLFMGFMVGMIAYSIIVPIYEITQNINP